MSLKRLMSLRLLSFLKERFFKIALLLNCRSNIYIPQFARCNCRSTGSLVVSTLKYHAERPELFNQIWRELAYLWVINIIEVKRCGFFVPIRYPMFFFPTSADIWSDIFWTGVLTFKVAAQLSNDANLIAKQNYCKRWTCWVFTKLNYDLWIMLYSWLTSGKYPQIWNI